MPSENSSRSISVVMCAFNPEHGFFHEAIESVLAQTFPDWELLIVDNGSSNGGDTLAREYAAKDSRIRYFEHPGRVNKGPAGSRNLGIAEARGKYVAFLDADDWWIPEHLARKAAAMEQYPAAALAFGGLVRWSSWSGQGADELEEHVQELTQLDPPEFIFRLLRNESIPGMSSLIARRSVLCETKGFEESLLWAEDQTISYKIGLRYPVLILPGWDMKYRRHPASTTALVEKQGSVFSDHLRFLDWVGTVLHESRVENPALWQLFQDLRQQYRKLVLKEKIFPRALRNFLKGLLSRKPSAA